MNCYPFACDSPEFFSALAVIEVIKVRHEDEYRRDESKRFIFCEIVSSACHVFFFSLSLVPSPPSGRVSYYIKQIL